MTFASWLRSLARGTERNRRNSRRAASRTRRSSPRLAVAALEDRTVPSAVAFSAVQTYPSGGAAPGSVAAADFNGDGHIDFAVTNQSSGIVGVFLGNSSGVTPAGTFGTGGSNPSSVAVGDFNNDGHADLAVANQSPLPGNIGVLLGNGAGSFAAATTFVSGGSNPFSIAVADFNNDGKADLTVANVNGNSVSVLLGDGSGGFAPPTTFTTGGGLPRSVAVADFNNDGKTDLAVTNGFNATVGVLLGDGSGGFASTVTFATGGVLPLSVAVGDFNADGNADLAVANRNSNTVSVLLGNGLGGFAPAVTFASGGSSPSCVTVGDLNADGNADLAVANAGSNTVAVLQGDGSGGFVLAGVFGSGGSFPNSVAVGDFNNDGQHDLAVTNGFSNNVGVLRNSTQVNHPPVANDDSASLTEDDASVSGSVLTNDTDADTTTLTVASPGTFNGTYGALTLNSDGSYNYVLNTAGVQHLAEGASVTDSFSYQASDGITTSNSATLVISITGINDAPVANDDSASLTEDDASVSGSVLTNDTDADTTTLTVASPGTFNGTYGALTLNSDGSYSYVLNTAGVQHLAEGASVTDSFSYQASDGLSSSNTATLAVTITGVNDAPVNTVPGDQIAAEDVAKVISGLSVADVDGAGILTVTLTAGHGTLTVDSGFASANGTVLSGNGTASLTLTGTQAQINATLGAGLTYLGGLNYSGLDTVTMTTTDAGGLSDTDGVTVQVLSAQQQADVLAAIIADLGDDGVLNGGQENALIRKLRFLSGPNGANTLQAFINQVNGLVHAGILEQSQGAILIDAAARIVASLQ